MTPRGPEIFRPAGSGSPTAQPTRLESLKVRNFRALRRVEIEDLTPLTVLVGPNGSGKSTVFEVLAFLSECFESGLRRAWDRRGRARGIRTRGEGGPVTVELDYRERANEPPITYHLEIAEEDENPVVVSEWAQWKPKPNGTPFRFLDYCRGRGHAVSGEAPDSGDERNEVPLRSPDLLAADALGQFRHHPRIAALRAFIHGWHMSRLSAGSVRAEPGAGPPERLSKSGDNLANVIRYLSEQHPHRLRHIFERLRRRVPRFESCRAAPRPDGRLLLQMKDAPFDEPTTARFASDGALRMLAYLVLLHDPAPAPLIAVEAPEHLLHPRLLPELAEEFRAATERAQLLVTTHSPFFLDVLRPEEVRILWRDEAGHTRSRRAADSRGVAEFVRRGANLGSLWTEGHFGVGDPLTRSGAPIRRDAATAR